MSITLNAPGGICNMYTRPVPETGESIEPVVIHVDGMGEAELSAFDLFDKKVDWNEHVTAPAAVDFNPGMGYYRIVAARNGKELDAIELGIIPPHHEGVRPDSFFASNTGGQYKAVPLEEHALGLLSGEELELAQAIGLKVMRCHFQAIDNLDVQDLAVQEAADRGLWVLPLAGYAFPGQRSQWAEQLNQYGPPDDFNAFVEHWRAIITRYPQIRTWEFWNEPWIFEWTWADTPHRYRELQAMWCRMALDVDPDLRLIAGSSYMFVEDHIESHPECWRGLIQGITHHPYLSVSEPHNRDGANARSVDSAVLVNRRMGLKYCYLTEGGAWYGENTPENAYKLVQYFVRSALSGVFQCNSQWGIGIAPGWTRPNTAYAVMTHMLEDRPVVADIWPRHELIFGAVFANPNAVDDSVRRLSRAGDVSARWNVPVPPDRMHDSTRVAVIWCMTGGNNDEIDTEGRIIISPADDLRAFDIVGREFIATDNRLDLPFNLNPVYITTERLSVVDLHRRIATARIENITPVNLYAQSLSDSADQSQILHVRIENQMNTAIRGRLALTLPGGQSTQADIHLTSGELDEVALTWPGCPVSPENLYPIELTAHIDTVEAQGGRSLTTVTRRQVVQTARFVRKAIDIDGSRNQWMDLIPITLLTTDTENKDDIEYLLNPLKKREIATVQDSPTRVRVYTAYDNDRIFIAVDGWPANPIAGEKWHDQLPFSRSEPAGLGYPAVIGDAVQFAFGFHDRVPGYGRQMNDHYAWKGHFCDTDYHYLAYNTHSGPKLVRQWKPGTTRQTAYQLDDIPHVREVPGCRITIVERIWTIAIPRTEVPHFSPDNSRLRFGINLNNNELSWSRTAGVFDHWWGSGSFGPSWSARLPCQSWFAIQ